jgi:hypothetical protein
MESSHLKLMVTPAPKDFLWVGLNPGGVSIDRRRLEGGLPQTLTHLMSLGVIK